MTAQDLGLRVAKRFPDIKPAVHSEIKDEATAYTEEDLFTLWEYFSREYTNVTAPHWGVFSKMAYKLDLYPKGRVTAKSQAYEYLCMKPIGGPVETGGVTADFDAQRYCMKRFHIGEAYCPQCSTGDAAFWVITKPGSVIKDPDGSRAAILRLYAIPAVAHTKRKPGDGAIGDKLMAREGVRLAIRPEELRAIKIQQAQDIIEHGGGSVDAEDADWIEALTGSRPPVKSASVLV